MDGPGENSVYWAYNGDNPCFHYYQDCPSFDSKKGMVSGTEEKAIIKKMKRCPECWKRLCEEKKKKAEPKTQKPKKQEPSESRKGVYWVANGIDEIWHLYPDCVKLEDVEGVRNTPVDVAIDNGKNHACALCKERLKKESKEPIMRVSPLQIQVREKNLVYWMGDRKSDCYHTERTCPNVLFAGVIGQGTIEEAVASGHVVACQECKRIQADREKEKEERDAAQRAAEDAQKKQDKQKIAHAKATSAFLGVFFTLIVCACFFSGYLDEQMQKSLKEGYDSGYEDGENVGYEDGYGSGYETGLLDGEGSGYEMGYDEGYRDGVEDASAGYSSNSSYDYGSSDIIVYVTDTGNKYHNLGCQYLSQSCYSISLDDAIEQGYTACSVCW